MHGKHSEASVYVIRGYWRNRWQRYAGLRLNHLLLSCPRSKSLLQAVADKAVRGNNDAGDHSPLW